ncbi:cell division protein ZapA (FtsZ GTPase activity inhibitor) [Pseudomonas hunanensis]|uniref:Cell division protein ZapA (FtsZ GTPase activity inhibitor) n=1 Tax=Pseudomonas hunanensis TaxID=1247546 RepID=A0ACC6K294_9PSED|nr:DUF3618 domain-containing protein [Pseudomonas hunanensis]MDR6712550.1 cell division protein ZapA (FtsZ GTPase activity inhibitor) [Pseudomonas hunanensis]
MTTSFEHDTQKDPDLLEQEINAKREHISDLVDALEQRLSPGQLMDQVLAYGKGNGGEFFHNLGTTLKNNPVPTTLTVLGLAWLGLNQNRPFNPGPAHSGPGLGEKLGEAVDSVKGAFSHAGEALHDASHTMRTKAHDLGDRAGALGQGARESVAGSADSLRGTAQQIGDQATALKGQFDHLLKEQPLVLAALGIALGAALGAALPSTRKEDELMGASSDRLTDTLKAKGEQAKQAVTETVRQTTAKDAPSGTHRASETDLSSGLGFPS